MTCKTDGKKAPAIAEEVREIKRQLAAKFDYDIGRIGADVMRFQEELGVPLTRRPKTQRS